ncbi:hypothetical protein MW887_000293 [Aspergillus wentii]|nr:hypothetical protein MW887_000293 [Aspergillus wentii]
MIVPVMPDALVHRAGIPWENRAFWVSILLMVEAGSGLISCPLFGWLVDRSRTRSLPFLGGLFLLGTSMIMLALAHAPWMFVAARILQGSSSSMVMVAGLALITDTVPADSLGQTIGYLGSAISCGFMFGPMLGGLVYEHLGYNAVFVMAFIVVLFDVAMRLAVIEKRVAARWLPETGIVSPRTEHQTFPGGHPQTPEHVESQSKPALLLLLRQPQIVISSIGLLMQGLIFSAFDSFLPIFVQSAYGWSALGAGLVFTAPVIAAFFEPYFGHLSDRYGNRIISVLAFLLLAPTLILFRFVESNTTPHKVIFLTLLALIGVFVNLCMPALFVETQSVLESMERAQPGIFGKRGAVAQAFGLQTMYQFLGMFLGPMFGVFEWRFGWEITTLVLGLLAAATAVPMFWLSGSEAVEARADAEAENIGERERLLDGNRAV